MAFVPAASNRNGYPLGLTGATADTRYVGATTSGAPVAGTFAVGDYVIDRSGAVYVCTAAGTPGTWAALGANGIPATIFDAKGDLVAASAADTAARLAVGADNQVLVAASGQAAGLAYAYPPGFEISYTQITSNANLTDTSEATATALITLGAATYDGAAVVLEFYCASISMPTAALTNTLTITLFEGATQLGRLAQFRSDQTANQDFQECYARYRFTPTAASHTYKICGFVSSTTGTPTLAAGAGGTGVFVPAFARTTKV